MKKTLFIIISCSITFFMACSSTKFVDVSNQSPKYQSLSLEKFNDKISNESVQLTLRNGNQLEVEKIHLQVDSTTFEETHSGHKIVVPTDSILQFRTINYFLGIPKGIFFGALIGGIATAIFSPTGVTEGVGGRKLSIAEGGIIGGATGLVIGIAAGEEIIYKLEYNSVAQTKSNSDDISTSSVQDE